MAFTVGIVLALAIGGFARWLGLDRERSFYSTVMMVIALLYVLFATIGGASSAVLFVELGICVAFVVLAATGFKRSLWLVVAALVLHGVYDLAHPHVFINPGVPHWWPQFCSAYDITAGILLATLLSRARKPTRAEASCR
jgi:hypothetical protein